MFFRRTTSNVFSSFKSKNDVDVSSEENSNEGQEQLRKLKENQETHLRSFPTNDDKEKSNEKQEKHFRLLKANPSDDSRKLPPTSSGRTRFKPKKLDD